MEKEGNEITIDDNQKNKPSRDRYWSVFKSSFQAKIAGYFKNKKKFRSLVVAVLAVFILATAAIIVRQNLIGADVVPYQPGSKVWTGEGPTNNWNDDLNWRDINTNFQTGIPGTDDAVTFNGTGANGNKNCSINVPVTVSGITITSGYNGTIIGGANNLTTTIFIQAGGTLVAPSGTLTISDVMNRSGGTFNHNSGTVKFVSKVAVFGSMGTIYQITTGGAAFNNVIFENSSSCTDMYFCGLVLMDSFSVAGNLIVQNLNTRDYDVVGVGNDGVSPTISINVSGNFSFTSPNNTNSGFGGTVVAEGDRSGEYPPHGSTCPEHILYPECGLQGDRVTINLYLGGNLSTGSGTTMHSDTFFNGSGDQALAIDGSIAGNNTWTNNNTGGVVKQNSNVTYGGNLTLNAGSIYFTNGSSCSQYSGYELSVAGTYSNNGTLRVRGDENLTLTQDSDSGTTEFVGCDNNSKFNYSIKDFSNSGYDYNNLTLNSVDNAPDQFILRQSLSVRGNFTIIKGNFFTYDVPSNNYSISIGGGLINHGGIFYLKGNESITYSSFDSVGGTIAYTNRGVSEIIDIRDWGGTGYYNLSLLNFWGCYGPAANPVLYKLNGPLVVHNDFNLFGGYLWNINSYPITVDGKTTVGMDSYCDSGALNPNYNPDPEFYSPAGPGSELLLTFNGGVEVVDGIFGVSLSTVDINRDLIIHAGAIVNAPFIMTISGNMSNLGTFNATTTGSVTFDGAGNTTQNISGNINFNDFIARATTRRTLAFAEGYSYYFFKKLIITGSPGELITLRSPSNGTWTINPQVATLEPSVSYVDVSHSTNIGAPFCATYSVDSGNNLGWNITAKSSCDVPNDPSDVNITNINTTRFDVTWTDNSSNETGFQVFSAPAGDNCSAAVYNDPPVIASANATSQNITGKNINTRYCAKVITINEVSLGDIYYSDPAFSGPKYTLANIPNAPTLTQSASGSTNIKINKNNNPDSTQYAAFVTDGSSFNKYLNPSGSFQDNISWHSYSDLGGDNGVTGTGLLINKNYTWRVKARNGDLVETAYSPGASSYTLANVPTAPALTAVSSNRLKITLGENGNPSGTTYAIFNEKLGAYLKHADGTTQNNEDWQTYSAWGGMNGFDNINLNVNDSYGYKVKARNGDNIETDFSPSANRYTLANIPVVSVDADYDTTSGYHLDSIISANLNPAGTEYYLQYASIEAGPYLDPYAMAWQAGTNYIFNKDSANVGLLPNTQYWLVVKARNGDGVGTNYSLPVPDVTPPAAPGNLVISNICSDTALASWVAATGANSYNLSYGTDTNATNLGTTSNIIGTSHILSGLSDNTTYYWKVSSTSAANGTGAYSSIQNFATGSCLVAAPTDFAGTASSSTSINWTWSDLSDNEDNYKVLSTSGTSLSGNLGGNITSWPESGLSLNTAYTRHVNVSNSMGSADSNQATVYTLANSPAVPTVTALGSDSLKIIINRNSNPLANTRYAIFNDTLNQYLRTDGSTQATEDWQLYANWGGANGLINTGLTPNTLYSYRVKAENGDFIPTLFSPAASATTYETYTVTVNIVGDGTVDQNTQSVNYGSNLTATATTAISSSFFSWSGCDSTATTICNLTNITSDRTITATFTTRTFTITAQATGTGGTINPPGATIYNYGGNATYTMTPDVTYTVFEILVDGAPINQTNGYSFNNITADHTISVSFGLVPIPETGDLTITSPDSDFAYHLFNDQKVTWEQTAGTNRDNTDHYRLSYSVGPGQLNTIADNIGRDIREQTFDLNESICPIDNSNFRIQLEAVDGGGRVVDSDYIVGTITLPALDLQIIGAGSPNVVNEENHYSIALSPSESADFSGRLIAENQVDISGMAQLNWKVNGAAGIINPSGHFTASGTTGLYRDAVELTATICGKIINSYITVRIRDQYPIINNITAPIEKAIEKIGLPPKIVSPTVTTGTAVAVGALLFAAPLANLASLYSISEFLRSIWYALLALFGVRNKKKWGRVIEEESRIPIPMAKVTLVRLDWDPLTKTTKDKEFISTYTDKKGYYGLVAQPGKYTINVAKRGYTVSSNLINGYVPGTVLNIHNYNESLVIPDIAMTMAEKSLASKAIVIRTIEELERAFRIIAVVLLLVGTLLMIKDFQDYPGAVSIIMMVVYAVLWIINIYTWLDKSPWGMVIDKSNNNPIPLALIRIYNSENSNLIRTTVSNMSGRFSAFVPKGSYKIIATKTGYREVGPMNFTTKKELINVDNRIEMERGSTII